MRVYLALWRDWARLTQEQLGGRIHPPVDKGTISRWETAPPGRLSLGVIAAYAEAVGRPVVDMYRPPPKEASNGAAAPSLDALAQGLEPDLWQRAADVITALQGRKAS